MRSSVFSSSSHGHKVSVLDFEIYIGLLWNEGACRGRGVIVCLLIDVVGIVGIVGIGGLGVFVWENSGIGGLGVVVWGNSGIIQLSDG